MSWLVIITNNKNGFKTRRRKKNAYTNIDNIKFIRIPNEFSFSFFTGFLDTTVKKMLKFCHFKKWNIKEKVEILYAKKFVWVNMNKHHITVNSCQTSVKSFVVVVYGDPDEREKKT